MPHRDAIEKTTAPLPPSHRGPSDTREPDPVPITGHRHDRLGSAETEQQELARGSGYTDDIRPVAGDTTVLHGDDGRSPVGIEEHRAFRTPEKSGAEPAQNGQQSLRVVGPERPRFPAFAGTPHILVVDEVLPGIQLGVEKP